MKAIDGQAADTSRPLYVSYIERTRAYYLARGHNNPYRWAHFDEVPFAPLTKPLAQARLALVTTAAPYQPDKGDQGPGAAYNNDAKFDRVYTMKSNELPDLRISHIGYDRVSARTEDMRAYFPLERLQELQREGRFAGLPGRFYGVPTLRSQRQTNSRDAHEILELCREDAVDAALLVAV